MKNLSQKTVAIIGRPNVGKSTLFNRLIGRRMAIETPIPGTTRDRLFGEVFWRGKTFNLIDVAGIEFGGKSEIEKNIQEGVDLAIEEADLLIFLVDWNDKDNEIDKTIARKLRKSKKQVILVVNKCDNLERINNIREFNRFGNFLIVPVSAISGKNTGDLLDNITDELKKIKKCSEDKEEKHGIKLAIIGRPNVGKSTLINAFAGEKRAIVSSVPGTTRDVVNISFSHKGQNLQLNDTAGIRRRGKIIKDTVESFALLRTYKALKECDIAILIIDGDEGLVSADANILGVAKEWGKGIILAVNKIDLWEDAQAQMGKMISLLQTKLNFTPWLPIVFISAKDKENIDPLLNQVLKAKANRETQIEQVALDEILKDAKEKNSQIFSIVSLRQKKSSPPTFEAQCKIKKPHITSMRYLENKIRDCYPMEGTPIYLDLLFKSKAKKR